MPSSLRGKNYLRFLSLFFSRGSGEIQLGFLREFLSGARRKNYCVSKTTVTLQGAIHVSRNEQVRSFDQRISTPPPPQIIAKKGLELENVPFQASLFQAANRIFLLGKSSKAPSTDFLRLFISSAMYFLKLASCLNSSVESPLTTSLA